MKWRMLMAALLVVGLVAVEVSAQPGQGGRGGQGGPGGGGRGGAGGRGGRGGQPGAPGGFLARLPLMQVLDADGDGELSEDEIDGAVAALKKLDKNQDGKISAEEMLPAGGFGGAGGRGGGPGGGAGGRGGAGGGDMVARFMAYDENKDGKVSEDEMPERMRPILDRVDSDGDGVLDKKEIEAFVAQMAARGGRGGAGGRGGGPGGGAGGRGGDGGGRPRRPETDDDIDR